MTMEQYPSDMAAPSPSFRKKRGRPKKAEKTIPQQMDDASGAKSKTGLAKSAGSGSARKKRQQGESPLPAPSNVSDSDAEVEARALPRDHGSSRPLDVNVGQRVEGVVDGLFDAGYLVTIRVGATDTVFRGVVFGPGLAEPLGVHNDVAPALPTRARQEVSESALPHKPLQASPNSHQSEDQSGIVTAASARVPTEMADGPSPRLLPPVSSANNASSGYSPGPVSYRSSPFSQSLPQKASPGSFYRPAAPFNPNDGKEDRPLMPSFPPPPAYGYE